MAQVIQVAELYGWRWAHFRPARTSKGWRTPASGPLGAGWPDLVLTRERDGRMVLVELKVDDGRVSDDQSAVLDYLERRRAPSRLAVRRASGGRETSTRSSRR